MIENTNQVRENVLAGTVGALLFSLVGGALCLIGQVLIDRTSLTPARILTGFVVAGVVLSAIGLYEPLAEFAGAGATVPLSGFGHLLASGVRDAVATDGFFGVLTGGLIASAGGIAAAIFFGLLCGILAPQKQKTRLYNRQKEKGLPDQ